MLEQHFLYCWNCGTRNSISKDKCDKCGKKLLHE
jgi:ribosomal protein L40E